ncbi:predicted protein [Uncinocarpus reesii 1704]|uniref:Hemerythrin-like domain-containing protein n=1 Tax=Uncinocarpus reesii (strain UAMH 1704) TaxID=336963 RepID=C4JW73_UNCRE|nr:uncharacterized protein UREG_06815 [Uncinocarpus reesii 1704]EEP81950.1 predicted protein [Uncinocarpus reesii 1704]
MFARTARATKHLTQTRFAHPSIINQSTRLFAASAISMTKISETIKTDHRDLEGWYQKIINPTSEDEQVRAQNQFVWELARHSLGEELVVYPALEKHVQGGKALADKDREEHQVVKELLKKFQNMKPADTEYMPTIKSLMDNLSQHIKEEESEDLVRLESALDQADSESLTKSFHRTKMFVPTRSHPSAPAKPPFETAVGLMTAPIDHLKDLFRKFPDQKISPNPSMK